MRASEKICEVLIEAGIETDFAKIAQGFSCQGVRVNTAEELRDALKTALAGTEPTVMDVITNPSEPFFKMINQM